MSTPLTAARGVRIDGHLTRLEQIAPGTQVLVLAQGLHHFPLVARHPFEPRPPEPFLRLQCRHRAPHDPAEVSELAVGDREADRLERVSVDETMILDRLSPLVR